MEKLVVLIIVLLSVATTPLTLKKLIDRPKHKPSDSSDAKAVEGDDKEDKNELF